MKIALTCNGPGEFAGWFRPLLGALYEADPALDATVFFVPDDYATGREADVARALFPQLRVFDPKEYVRFAFGRSLPDAPRSVDVVQYLGGDLMHAARLHGRLGGRARTYKFWSHSYRRTFERVYAVDPANEKALRAQGVAGARIEAVGNLVVDGVLGEVAGRFATRDEAAIPEDGVLILPGNRRHEIASLVPLFLQMAVHLGRLMPDLPIAFGLSPFTTKAELERALATGGHRLFWGARGTVVEEAAMGGAARIPVVRDAMRHAGKARLVVTIPGTKCIELAALGVPTIVCTPLNAPELAVVNGPFQYIDRLPLVGVALKRAAVVAVNNRFRYTAQPNIDAGEMLMPELRGTLTPGRIARVVAAYAQDTASLAADAPRLRELYASHRGAASRMAHSLLEHSC
jgi:lipid A disaccharide synthetase